MKILVIGGTGNISYPYVVHAASAKHNIFIVNRSSDFHLRRKISSPFVQEFIGDVKDKSFLNKISCDYYDVIVDFLCYCDSDAQARIMAFRGKVGHYIFISTTAGYSKSDASLPYTEKTPFTNLSWDYVADKFKAELRFKFAYESINFPVTIARLGHTYDSILPIDVGPSDWTVPSRVLKGLPIVMHGDGSGVWTITHANDVASAIHQIASKKILIGDLINIVSARRTTWNEVTVNIFTAMCKETTIFYRKPAEINAVSSYYGNGILWHKMWDDFYDNSKLKGFLPGWVELLSNADGIKSSINWYMENEYRQKINPDAERVLDILIKN